MEAVVRYIHAVGPTVRLELDQGSGVPLDAELTRGRIEELGLETGETVDATPRKLQTFTDDYSI